MTDSPLQAFLDAPAGPVRFALGRPAAPVPAPIEGLLAGAAEVDITPPPGMPKAGFSKNAHDGVGFRTRLRARVVHLRGGPASLAIVQLDLLSGSSLLQRLVADAIAERTDVPLAGLFLGATHTHAGPGQFDASAFYNRFASNRSGFDPAWTQFLVDRIAGAVVEAVATRRPARLALGRTEVWGLTRNRSLAPYLRNATVEDKRDAAHRKFAAVNPWLHLLRVDAAAPDGGHEPLAALGWFSVHGTGISHHCHEYHADVWAYVAGELAAGIERSTGTKPVAGAMEATHADCAPAVRPGHAGYLEAERIGRGIGAAAAALHDRLEGELTDAVTLGAGLRELDLDAGAGTIGTVSLARPYLGASQVAGATENTTPVLHLLPPFRAGFPKPVANRGDHGPKWVLASKWLQPLILPTAQFPRVLSLQVLRIGDHTVVGAPFEITVEAGRRVAAEVGDRTSAAAPGTVIVSSVANGYCGYCTTAEEYELQYYEGGHNLHGPTTQSWLAHQAARLAGDVMGAGGRPVTDVVAERAFDLPGHRYLPGPTTPAVRRVAGEAVYHDPAGDDHGYWEQQFRGGDLTWHEPIARVERADGGDRWRTVADDQRWAVGVVEVAPVGGARTYAARWFDPWLGDGPRHRFVLAANGGHPELTADAFG